MSQDRSASFHFTAHVLHRRLLPVWGEARVIAMADKVWIATSPPLWQPRGFVVFFPPSSPYRDGKIQNEVGVETYGGLLCKHTNMFNSDARVRSTLVTLTSWVHLGPRLVPPLASPSPPNSPHYPSPRSLSQRPLSLSLELALSPSSPSASAELCALVSGRP